MRAQPTRREEATRHPADAEAHGVGDSEEGAARRQGESDAAKLDAEGGGGTVRGATSRGADGTGPGSARGIAAGHLGDYSQVGVGLICITSIIVGATVTTNIITDGAIIIIGTAIINGANVHQIIGGLRRTSSPSLVS